jgi:hypothetical protein
MSVEAWKSLFDVLTVVLLGLTFAAGAGVLITGNIINRRQEEKLRNFDVDLTAAKAGLAAQQERAAKAEEQLARLKTPRSLTAEQQQRIATKISEFAGTQFDMHVSADQDSTNLMGLVLQALQDGKWQFKPPGTSIEFAGKAGIISDSGVSVHFFGDRKDLEKPALTLTNAINAEGIKVKGCYRDSEKDWEANHWDKNNVHVLIGSKPLD